MNTKQAETQIIHVEVQLGANSALEAAITKRLTDRLDQDLFTFWLNANLETRNAFMLLLRRLGDPGDDEPLADTVPNFIASVRGFCDELEGSKPPEPGEVVTAPAEQPNTHEDAALDNGHLRLELLLYTPDRADKLNREYLLERVHQHLVELFNIDDFGALIPLLRVLENIVYIPDHQHGAAGMLKAIRLAADQVDDAEPLPEVA